MTASSMKHLWLLLYIISGVTWLESYVIIWLDALTIDRSVSNNTVYCLYTCTVRISERLD